MHNSKVCFKCNEEKPLTSFYKHSQMGDGYLNKCKDCTKKDSRNNRDKNIDYYREYDKSRSTQPKRVEARMAYSQTEQGKDALRRAKQKWSDLNVIKRSANILVCNHVRDGKIAKPDVCEGCNNKHTLIHGHHDDYAKPLEVRWLCPACHRTWHKEHGEALNG